MLKTKLFFSLALITLLAISLTTFAQEQISGPQTGTLGPGTYEVVGNIRVVSGQTLTIMPGTEFLHSGNYVWEIFGTLLAQGAEGDSIVFDRLSPIEGHKWGGIRFQTGASNESVIDYCIIDWCKRTGTPVAYGAAIYATGIELFITNSRISNASNYWDGGGIYGNNASLNIDHCVIANNTAASGSNGGGITLNSCNGTSITNSIIARNSATGT